MIYTSTNFFVRAKIVKLLQDDRGHTEYRM
jgi:hypothetical protein